MPRDGMAPAHTGCALSGATRVAIPGFSSSTSSSTSRVPSIDTSWSTIQARASGVAERPPWYSRPVTATPPTPPTPPTPATRCASRATAPAPESARSRSALRRELAEVFRIEVLEVGLQRVRVERGRAGLAPALAGLDRGKREQAIAREDGRLEPQRDRDGVGGPRVDLNHRVAAIDVQLGVVGVVLHLRDDDLAQVGAESRDDLLQEVVREGPRELHAGELHRNGARLRGTDPDREHALPFPLLQDHDRRVGRPIQPEVGHPHFDDAVARCQGPKRPGISAVPGSACRSPPPSPAASGGRSRDPVPVESGARPGRAAPPASPRTPPPAPGSRTTCPSRSPGDPPPPPGSRVARPRARTAASRRAATPPPVRAPAWGPGPPPAARPGRSPH